MQTGMQLALSNLRDLPAPAEPLDPEAARTVMGLLRDLAHELAQGDVVEPVTAQEQDAMRVIGQLFTILDVPAGPPRAAEGDAEAPGGGAGPEG